MNSQQDEAGKVAGKVQGLVMDQARVIEIMKAHGEMVRATQLGFYPSLGALAEQVRSCRNWSEGETFVYALSDSEFVIMKQVAPASCEMMTVTQNGYHDVLTAYRYDQEELVARLSDYMSPSASRDQSGVVEDAGKLQLKPMTYAPKNCAELPQSGAETHEEVPVVLVSPIRSVREMLQLPSAEGHGEYDLFVLAPAGMMADTARGKINAQISRANREVRASGEGVCLDGMSIDESIKAALQKEGFTFLKPTMTHCWDQSAD